VSAQALARGQAGYICIDTVHQGDKDKQKGDYHLNAVGEATQFEVLFSVEKISERYLIPALEQMLDAFLSFCAASTQTAWNTSKAGAPTC
tara:strand:- start:808 stop:1077 length:270 start_codon:yes stop_codon:yes gene_type:complete